MKEKEQIQNILNELRQLLTDMAQDIKMDQDELKKKEIELNIINKAIEDMQKYNIPVDDLQTKRIIISMELGQTVNSLELIDFALSEIEEIKSEFAGYSSSHKSISKVVKGEAVSMHSEYSGSKPEAFLFMGERTEVKNWRDLLQKVSITLFQRHDNFIEIAKAIKGSSIEYFSNTPENMNRGVFINELQIFIETRLSAIAVMNIINKLLDKLGYSRDVLKIVYKN